MQSGSLLGEAAPAILTLLNEIAEHPALLSAANNRCEFTLVTMRDGKRLATDIYRPSAEPAPVIIIRTPYGRDSDRILKVCTALVERGYIVVAQDCRGTGASEPDCWDYYVREPEDSFDLVDWITEQPWCDGFIGACGSSYAAQVQWSMATHPRMTTIVPEVSGLGIAAKSTRLYMFLNAYARTVGKGAGKISVGFDQLERQILDETLLGGYFCEPLYRPFPPSLLSRYPLLRKLSPPDGRRYLWAIYCSYSCAERVDFINSIFATKCVSISEIEMMPAIFGQTVAHDAHTLPSISPRALFQSLAAPALMITGWYDWGLNDTLATWDTLENQANKNVSRCSRLLITPSAHNTSGYHEQTSAHKAVDHTYRTPEIIPLLDGWYRAVATGDIESWPKVIFFLMGTDEWRIASAWPPPETRYVKLFLSTEGRLRVEAPSETAGEDSFIYRPQEPTPTVGGSIVSYVYQPGSVDVAAVQERPDVLTYTIGPLDTDIDVIGPLRMILFASSSALDTDFSVRLSDVFPDGRAIQIQSGILRARFRDSLTEPSLLEPNRVYRFEIDMWATANRFKAGHGLRIDISSSDFPRFDRHANRIDDLDSPLDAVQAVQRNAKHPSHLLLPVVVDEPFGRGNAVTWA